MGHSVRFALSGVNLLLVPDTDVKPICGFEGQEISAGASRIAVCRRQVSIAILAQDRAQTWRWPLAIVTVFREAARPVEKAERLADPK